ncbi:MAG TPA: ABC transporter permease, partial [Usitatibacter sp.]|nr:ABC transporter permease [Usitatibacter sp.]
MKAFAALVRKDVVLYFSNRRALLVTLAAPILIAAFFGSVLGGAPRKPTRIPVVVVDLDASPVSKAIVAGMKSDASFELREASEVDAVRMVREGQVRAAAVIPAGFGRAAPRALFRPDAKKPEIVVHYDPSQAFTLPLVRGLLAEHVMGGVSQAVFGASGAAPAFSELRGDVEASNALDAGLKRDLLSIFDGV